MHHNRTKNLNMELINKIRFELIPSEELVRLTDSFKLISDIINQIIQDRIIQENAIQATLSVENCTTAALGTSSTKLKSVNSTVSFKTTPPTTAISTSYTNTALLKITSTKISISENKLASGSGDNTVKIWNVDSGECIRTLTGHSERVEALHLLTDKKLASGSRDKLIKIWNIDSGKCIRTLTGHLKGIWSLQLIYNNEFASGSADNTIRIWNFDSGECVRTLTGHTSYIWSLKLLSNYTLASVSNDNSIRLWNAGSGECIRTLTNNISYVWSLQFLSDNIIARESEDNSIQRTLAH